MTKRKKRDPLAALRKKHPGPWKVKKGIDVEGYRPWWAVLNKDRNLLADVYDFSLARAIAKLGGK